MAGWSAKGVSSEPSCDSEKSGRAEGGGGGGES